MSGSGVVSFDYNGWQFRYPELATSIPEATANAYFDEATLYLDNTACSVVSDTGRRSLLLNMLVSHIAVLNSCINGEAPSPLVGHITSAGQGSESVGVSLEVPGSAQWFAQTRYGMQFWAATAVYRTMRYRARPQTIPLW